jgi:hypothetical protein
MSLNSLVNDDYATKQNCRIGKVYSKHKVIPKKLSPNSPWRITEGDYLLDNIMEDALVSIYDKIKDDEDIIKWHNQWLHGNCNFKQFYFEVMRVLDKRSVNELVLDLKERLSDE